MIDVRERSGGLAALMVLGALLSGCVSADGAPQSLPPTNTVGPSAEVSTPAGTAAMECYFMDENVDGPIRTIAALDPYTDSVVIAEVKAIEGGVWNTKNGAKPDKAIGPRFNPGIQTPINLQIKESIRGDHGPGAIRVVNPGGTAGCVEHIVSNAPHIEKGATYALFLQPSPDADGVRHPEVPLILAAYPVGPGGTVATEYDGTLSHDDFVTLVNNPVPTPSPTPEPTTDGPG